jgi:hypothetical protein
MHAASLARHHHHRSYDLDRGVRGGLEDNLDLARSARRPWSGVRLGLNGPVLRMSLFHPGLAFIAQVRLAVAVAHLAEAKSHGSGTRTTERRRVGRAGWIHRGGRCDGLLCVVRFRGQSDRGGETEDSKADKDRFVHAQTPLGPG